MKKFLILLVLLVSALHAYSYNELAIKAQSTIFPKVLLLDKKLTDKLVDGKIVFTIVCEARDLPIAQKLRKSMKAQYDSHLAEYALEIKVMLFSEFTDKTKATAVYLFNSDTDIERVTRLAKSSGYMTFAYDIINLQHGVLLSLIVEKSTVLYLNKKGLSTHDVDFVEPLYQIVKISNI